VYRIEPESVDLIALEPVNSVFDEEVANVVIVRVIEIYRQAS